MDEMIYVAMTGARQTEVAQTINSHNLANVSTTGFRADLHAFSNVPIEGPGVESRVNSVVDDYRTDFSSGPTRATNRSLDIAVEGDGFIVVQAADGNEAYTRRGDLRVAPGGLLTTGDGNLVLGEGGPVAVPPEIALTIGEDGTITVQPIGQQPNAVSIIDRIRLVNPPTEELVKGTDGLFRLQEEGEVAPPDSSVTLKSGHLEGSNVNITKTLVNMIELARQYEMQVNVIKSAEENADTAAQMMQLS